jgi:hypothetical protein
MQDKRLTQEPKKPQQRSSLRNDRKATPPTAPMPLDPKELTEIGGGRLPVNRW